MIDPSLTSSADDGHDLLAAEYALGVLDAEAHGAAGRRVDAEPGFAAEVAAWNARLEPLLAGMPEETPHARVWTAIERSLAANGSASGGAEAPSSNVIELRLRRNLGFWRSATFAAAAAAVILAAVLILPRSTVAPVATQVIATAPTARPALLTASLSDPKGRAQFVATVDPLRGEIVLTPAAIRHQADHSPELWLIPNGGKPISLGVADFSRTVRLTPETTVGAAGRVTLAVSIEPSGGSPTGDPTGPVVATGKLEAM